MNVLVSIKYLGFVFTNNDIEFLFIHFIYPFCLDSLLSLSERLVGPFNVEMTIEPISIKISDAIMNFQESGFQVTKDP